MSALTDKIGREHQARDYNGQRICTCGAVAPRTVELVRWHVEHVATVAQTEVLRDFARSIDLEALAEEWEGPDGAGHWSAGNAASAVQGAAFDRADRIEKESLARNTSHQREDQ